MINALAYKWAHRTLCLIESENQEDEILKDLFKDFPELDSVYSYGGLSSLIGYLEKAQNMEDAIYYYKMVQGRRCAAGDVMCGPIEELNIKENDHISKAWKAVEELTGISIHEIDPSDLKDAKWSY